MRPTTRSIAGLLGVVLVAGAHAAGAVQVSYVNRDKFADAGNSRHDVEDNLKQLTRHFEALAKRHLADGQKLSVEVLDVDLAGEMRPSRRATQDIRVLKGTTDWPRIKLRYTLESPGQPARSGERLVQDMAYLQRLGSNVGIGALNYEYRMLDEWFGAEFGHAAAR